MIHTHGQHILNYSLRQLGRAMLYRRIVENWILVYPRCIEEAEESHGINISNVKEHF